MSDVNRVNTTMMIKVMPLRVLINTADEMTEGTVNDEQKSLLMKIEAELIVRAKEYMSATFGEEINPEELSKFVAQLMDGVDDPQDLNAYDFERRAIAIAMYAELLGGVSTTDGA